MTVRGQATLAILEARRRRRSRFAAASPIVPREAGRRLKTLKTARAGYWLELAWIWDRRHVSRVLMAPRG